MITKTEALCGWNLKSKIIKSKINKVEAIIKLENAVIRQQKNTILKDVSLEIKESRWRARTPAHAGQQEILWALLFHQPQLIRKKLRFAEVINHMVTLYIISGITVGTAYGTADDQIHVLNIVLNADAHQRTPSTFFRMRWR